MSEKKRIEFMGYEWEKIGGKWLVKIGDSFYEIDWNDSENLINKLNEQQVIISALKEENEQLKIENQRLKNNCSILVHNQYIPTRTAQSKVGESLNMKDYVETDGRGNIVKVKLSDYIDDLIHERLNKKLRD